LIQGFCGSDGHATRDKFGVYLLFPDRLFYRKRLDWMRNTSSVPKKKKAARDASLENLEPEHLGLEPD
ncbi:hypothetical protein, partial [Stutzerimonas nitrititolerans]|uniref:hypothetical protein n=1 Tax=Stutzerimonas nitrititolerans TaxID=2482751 RepID=UPI0028AF515F